MSEDSLLVHIEKQFSSKLPFVIYRKPKKEEVNAIFLEDDALTFVKDYTEQGFVFAPFDSTQPVILFPTTKPKTFLFESPDEVLTEPVLFGGEATHAQKEFHVSLVQKGIDAINKDEMKKVVLSRKQTRTTALAPSEITARLLKLYPNAFVYCWYHPKVGLWTGATPETLLSVTGDRFKTMALAGTQPYKGILDVEWGEKEREEQQLVTDSILTHLQNKVLTIRVSKTQTHKAGNVLHLKTDISGILHEDRPLVELINALHPTPAVCGLPKTNAKDFILAHEGYDREFYTGYLGEINIAVEQKRARSKRNVENLAYATIRKTSELYVNLRCMQLHNEQAIIYVGGGITGRSNSQGEWEETVKKMETIGNILF